jgi:hypothetical protein
MYEIEIPGKGVFEVNSDKELTDSQAYEYALTQAEAQAQMLQGCKDLVDDSHVSPNGTIRFCLMCSPELRVPPEA